jgi:hypothetical protein
MCTFNQIISTYSAGTYDHDIARNRQVDWHQSFGGTPINLPSVKQHSTIDRNTEKVIFQAHIILPH